MVLYRLESKRLKVEGTKIGVGVYVNDIKKLTKSSTFIEMCGEHANAYTHPNLRDDLSIYSYANHDATSGFFCACPSLKKLEEWFDGYIDFILDANFVLVKYTVSDMFMGKSKKQCFFQNEHIISKKIIREKIKLQKVA